MKFKRSYRQKNEGEKTVGNKKIKIYKIIGRAMNKYTEGKNISVDY
jgi:hypothetical protein